MSHLLCCIAGGIIAAAFMCCLQINTINKYEEEIVRLRKELNND